MLITVAEPRTAPSPMLAMITELLIFGMKQARACTFGAYLLIIMITTKYYYPLEWLHRYDFIFFAAVVFQITLLVCKMETAREFVIIAVFHIIATAMELFKTSDSIASWTYPEEYIFGIGNVPLFTGFMYSAVGSYIARIWRIFDFRYTFYPKPILFYILAVFIYINFFSHHFIYDIRWILIVLTVILFRRTQVLFKVDKAHRRMPLLLGWALVALFIWIAENIATYANIWIYPNQQYTWQMVPIAKLTSWYLLMLLSFALVAMIHETRSTPSNFYEKRVYRNE